MARGCVSDGLDDVNRAQTLKRFARRLKRRDAVRAVLWMIRMGSIHSAGRRSDLSENARRAIVTGFAIDPVTRIGVS